MLENVFTVEQRDALQEIANLAMGEAATRLAGLFNYLHPAVGSSRVRRRCRRGHADPARDDRDRRKRDCRAPGLSLGHQRRGNRDMPQQRRRVPECARQRVIHGFGACETVSQTELIFDVANVLTGACVSRVLDKFDRTPSLFPTESARGKNCARRCLSGTNVVAWRDRTFARGQFRARRSDVPRAPGHPDGREIDSPPVRRAQCAVVQSMNDAIEQSLGDFRCAAR